MYSEEDYQKLQQKNIALETQIQILQQKVMFYEFEKRHQEKLKTQVQDEDREKLREKMNSLPEELLKKVAAKAKVEFPHFIDDVTHQFTIPIDTILLEDYKRLNKIINIILKNSMKSKRLKDKNVLWPQSESELNKALGNDYTQDFQLNKENWIDVRPQTENWEKSLINSIMPMSRYAKNDVKQRIYVQSLVERSKDDDILQSESTSDAENDENFDLNILTDANQ